MARLIPADSFGLAGRLEIALHRPFGDVPLVARELEDEWRFARHYLELEALRLGDRLVVREEIENAVRHGLAHRPVGGTVGVSARTDGEELILRVEDDDGMGCSPELASSGVGSGLRSLRQRLEVRHGTRAAVEVRTAPGKGFAVTVRLPASIEAVRVAV